IKYKVRGLWQNFGHRITSSFSAFMYIVDVTLDIYTVYIQNQTLNEGIKYLVVIPGTFVIIISSVVASTINYYHLRNRWSNGTLRFRWYHYFIYTGVGFLLLPLFVLVKSAIRAWSVDRKQIEEEESRDTKYVMVIESLVEGVLQFGLQMIFMVMAEPPFALA
ncbi:unnamed protein product, partial [Meganyctiphanes norvegica]